MLVFLVIFLFSLAFMVLAMVVAFSSFFFLLSLHPWDLRPLSWHIEQVTVDLFSSFFMGSPLSLEGLTLLFFTSTKSSSSFSTSCLSSLFSLARLILTLESSLQRGEHGVTIISMQEEEQGISRRSLHEMDASTLATLGFSLLEDCVLLGR